MKFIKTYENMSEPEIGDYVICQNPPKWTSINKSNTEMLNNFISSNIGKLVKNDIWHLPDNRNCKLYIIEYQNIPNEIEEDFIFNQSSHRAFLKEHIKHWSKNKKDLESYISSK